MRRVVNFNENQYNRKLNELENKVKSFNECATEVAELTQGKITEVNSAKLSIYAKQKTGFVDLSMSLKALGLQDIHSRIRNVELSGIAEDDCMTLTDGVLSIDRACLKDVFTTYFNESDHELIDELNGLVEASKGISSYILQNAIQFNRDGGLSINKARLNTVLQQMRRSQRMAK